MHSILINIQIYFSLIFLYPKTQHIAILKGKVMKIYIFIFSCFFTPLLFSSENSCAKNTGTILGALTIQILEMGMCCTQPAANRFRAVRSVSNESDNALKQATKDFHETRAARCTGYCALGCCACAAGECAACCCGSAARVPSTIIAASACTAAVKQTCYYEE